MVRQARPSEGAERGRTAVWLGVGSGPGSSGSKRLCLDPGVGEQVSPDLDKLRRFALAIGLVLITYSVAAVELDTGETIRPLGLPLKVNRPEYLGIGLIIASLWAMGRFLYYGVWKTESPPRKRGPLLKQLQAARPQFREEPDVEKFLDNFRTLFPRIPGFQITAATKKVIPEEAIISQTDRNRPELFTTYAIDKMNVPWPFYVAARIEDIDYFAPIWLNVIALGSWLYRIFGPGAVKEPW